MGGAWCSVVGAWLGSWWQRGGAAWTTLAVVLFLEGSLVLGAIVPLGALDSAWGGAAVLALQALVLLALTSGIIVTSADPGYVPRHQPAAHDGDEEEPAESEAATGRISLSEFLTVHERECSLCFAPKPTNAHHCSVCQRCVIKMDHHCIYLNNCIGFRNMKAFLLFLVYALLCSLCAFAFFVARAVQLYHTADNHSEEDLTWPIVLAVVNLGLLSLAIIATTGLCVRHLLAILRNQTVLETILKKPPMHNPGALANLKGVFGGAPWLWMLPTLATDPPSESHDSARFVDTRELAPAVVGRHHQYGEHDDDDDDGVSSPLH